MRILTEHPASVDETYTEHLAYAASVGGNMVLAGIACMIHGLMPVLFETTGSRMVAKLHSIMLEKRSGTYKAELENEKSAIESAKTCPTAISIHYDKAA